ncbi:MAG: sugar transferase [Clostridia bacterium]|nr:sugar transferase [Clostridia bacterium]
MQRKRFYATQLMRLGFQALLYILIFAAYFGMLSITNVAILNVSRTAAATMATFAVSLLMLTTVYGGFEVEHKKKRTVFANLCLATFFTDLITYVILQIMNTNPNNPEANATMVLWGEDLALMAGAFILQIGIIYFLTSMGFRCYYRINPVQDCCIITSSQEMAAHVATKMSAFGRKFNLTEVVHYECPDVRQTIRRHEVIFLAGIPDTEEAALQSYCYKHHKIIYLLAELEDVVISTAHQTIMDDTAFLYIRPMVPTLTQRAAKRTCDIVISLFGLIITSPVMLVTWLALKCSGNGSPFFRQKRATLNGMVFEIIKFRTMYEDSAAVSARENDDRVTPLGHFLRKYRIDELPQLFNVLRGEMSLVGPRPEMLENVDRYTREVPEFRYRQQMKAGLTGLAQIEGKYNTSPKDKAILDLLYIENFSLAYDFKLLLRTLTIFFRRDSTEGFHNRKAPCPAMRVTALDQASVPSDAPSVDSDQRIAL